MRPYQQIVVHVSGGTVVGFTATGFTTASTSGSTALVVDQGNWRTVTGGEPDTGRHVHATIGVPPPSGGVQWAQQPHSGDLVGVFTTLPLAGVCTYDFLKRA